MTPLLLSAALSVALLGGPAILDGGPGAEPTSSAPQVRSLAHWSHNVVEQTNEHSLLDVSSGVFGHLELHDCADCAGMLPVVVAGTGATAEMQDTNRDVIAAPVATSAATCTSGNCVTSNASCSSQELCTSHSSCSSNSSCTTGGQCTAGPDCSTGAKCTSGSKCTDGGRCTSEHGASVCSTGAACPTSRTACPRPVDIEPVGTVSTAAAATTVSGLERRDTDGGSGMALGFAGFLGLLGLGFDRKRKPTVVEAE